MKQFILFAMLGGVGTAGHYLTLILLVQLVGLAAVWATTAGFMVGAVMNYFLNYHLTFRSDKAHSETMLKFFIVALVGAGLNMMVMFLGVNILSLFYLLVQVAASFVVLLWTFSANKLWTFSENVQQEVLPEE
ncbi:MAG TPA: GtrA family protein [Gammaproteobacteria bacterium]|nr:GtrA family protein [Gammaproteobacteria bacterium]